MSQSKLKIKKGDTVKVLSGKDKGKKGKVIRVIPSEARVVVENVNIHTRFERSKRAGQPGQRVSFAAPMPVAKVQLVDPHSGEPSRVGYSFLDNKEKQRIAKTSGKTL